jgi:hypothetical protein
MECVEAQELPAFGITHLRHAVRCLNRYDENPMLFYEFHGIHSRAMRPRIFAISAILLAGASVALFINQCHNDKQHLSGATPICRRCASHFIGKR